MVEALKIALNAWIILDGNYGEFDVGDAAAFAVEFYPDLDATEIVAPVPAGPAILHVANATYRVTCPIVHLAPDWWVIDIGLPIYHSGAPPRGAALGKWLQASISLGIDPFFYFERLAKSPGAPALIFDWSVDAIEIQTAPFIEKAPGLMPRDPSRRAWKPIARTDAWHDDNGNAEYLLQCSLKGWVPRRTLDLQT